MQIVFIKVKSMRRVVPTPMALRKGFGEDDSGIQPVLNFFGRCLSFQLVGQMNGITAKGYWNKLVKIHST